MSYAHLHFWSIISVICCALYCNLHHSFVFINRIVWSKSRINYSHHIFIPFELSFYLINNGGTYLQPWFHHWLEFYMCDLSLSLSLIVPYMHLFLPLWSYVVNSYCRYIMSKMVNWRHLILYVKTSRCPLVFQIAWHSKTSSIEWNVVLDVASFVWTVPTSRKVELF